MMYSKSYFIKFHMDVKKEYDFLIKYVPPSTTSLFNLCTANIDAKRKKNIQTHRIIALRDILNNNKRTNRTKYNLSKSIEPAHDYVLNPTVLDPPITISPFLCQQTTTLFNHIHANTPDLVEALIKIKGTKLFDFMAISSIPSLFGYYSSNEHINLAMSFFVKVLSSTDSVTGSPLLSPFFSSPCLFRFYESSLSPFLDSFIREKKIDTNKINKFVRDITEYFIKSAPLIPQPHIVLLKMMRARWGDKNTCTFFFEKLLKNQTLLWYDTVRNDQQGRKTIQKILDKMDQMKILEGICFANSSIEVPFQYTVFDDPFLHFLTSISDVRALYSLFKDKLEMPSMNIILTDKVNKNAVFWIKTYPPHQLRASQSNFRLVFHQLDVDVPDNEDFERLWRNIQNLADDKECYPLTLVEKFNNSKEFKEYAQLMALKDISELSDLFEQFLRYKVNMKTIDKWEKVSIVHEHTMTAPIVKRMIVEMEKKYSKYEEIYEEIDQYLFSDSIKSYNYLFIIQRFLPKLLKGFIKDFEFVKIEMGDFLSKRAQNLENLESNLYFKRSSIFWEAVEMLRTLDCDDLPFQYTTLMRVLKKIYLISREKEDIKEIMDIAIALAGCTDIFYIYCVIDLFAMNHEVFRDKQTDKEQFLWFAFQKEMLQLVMDNEKLGDKYFYILEAFSE
ncbi:hypothetical protein TRFO_19770 [Tritrichomonas foetus]|uniref:Uncharacterized protein n=1 Tax=Tritrichomonas foetus TaxID=1144522 RepID=A0A1J4KM42_9EUKA|nr:hypothetical protein TRFO_19770 [Tritrichomonas foetus]|eukprot:OHT10868.1 hypothetical protein TRFO_19770 [Tritrichomonas foetus]